MASVFVLLEAFTRKEAAALGFFPCATAPFLSGVLGRVFPPLPPDFAVFQRKLDMNFDYLFRSSYMPV